MPSRLILVALMVLATSPSAQTQKAGQAEVDALYEQGMKLFDLKQYEKAIAAFQKAYQLSHLPGFLYNIALANRLRGQCEEAATYYRRYLDEAPDAPNRSRITALLDKMVCAPPTLEAPPLVRVPWQKRVLPWSSLGLGVAALATGITLEAVTRGAYADLKSTCAPACDPGRWQSPRTTEWVGWLLVGVGALAAAGSAGWLLFDDRLWLAPAGPAVTVGGTF